MKEFYIIKDDVQVGPFSPEQLKKMLERGTINNTTLARSADAEQSAQWKKISDLSLNPGESKKVYAKLLSYENGMMRLACPSCNQHYSVSEELFYVESFECNKCKERFRLPPRPNATSEFVNGISHPDFNEEVPDGDLLCPHCWKSFDHDYILYISVHPSLFGDPILGDYVPKRFVPTVFNQMGQPLDECGLPATEMACPRCHLRIPSGLLDTPSLYFSIAGATSSGKSYFLTCLTHQLRKTLPEYFSTAFFDADPRLNETLNSYEKQLFMSLKPHEITSLPATQIAGEGISDRIRLNDIEIELPKPFVFEFRRKDDVNDVNMIFYDNSGEMFIPGRDEWVNQATFHLSHSNGIMFLFDPTNDAAMRLALCDERDPQVSKNPRVVDQTVLFNEMISRVRRHANMTSAESCEIPLVVAVGKYDTWKHKFPVDVAAEPYITKKRISEDEEEYVLATENILNVSYALREMMLEYVPGLVNAAEGFFEKVFFVPVSNYGTFAEQNADGAIGVTPSKIKPIWVEVPMLLLLAENEQIDARKICDTSGEKLGKVIKDKVVFTHPGSGRIIRLPLNYAGAAITISGKKYRLPPAAEQEG